MKRKENLWRKEGKASEIERKKDHYMYVYIPKGRKEGAWVVCSNIRIQGLFRKKAFKDIRNRREETIGRKERKKEKSSLEFRTLQREHNNHIQTRSDQTSSSPTSSAMPPNPLTPSLSLIGCTDIVTQTKQKNGLQEVGKKDEVCNEIIKRLRDINHEAFCSSLDFADSIRAHFNRLPCRYV